MRFSVRPKVDLLRMTLMAWSKAFKPTAYINAFRAMEPDEVLVVQFDPGELATSDIVSMRNNIHNKLRGRFPDREIHGYIDRQTSHVWFYWTSGEIEPEVQRNKAVLSAAMANGTVIVPTNCQACERELPLKAYWWDEVHSLLVSWLCKTCYKDISVKHGTGARIRT